MRAWMRNDGGGSQAGAHISSAGGSIFSQGWVVCFENSLPVKNSRINPLSYLVSWSKINHFRIFPNQELFLFQTLCPLNF